jgi:hypothetical protein
VQLHSQCRTQALQQQCTFEEMHQVEDGKRGGSLGRNSVNVLSGDDDIVLAVLTLMMITTTIIIMMMMMIIIIILIIIIIIGVSHSYRREVTKLSRHAVYELTVIIFTKE